jgi:hypothetical protein
MTSFSKVLCGRVAFGMALWACACERDSAALFDDGQLPALPAGGAQGAVAGSSAIAGDDAGADSGGGTSGDTGGSTADAGSGAGSSGGVANEGGAASAGSAGKPGAGEGGKAGAATAGGGAGGTKPDPEPDPVTITIGELEDAYVASCMQYVNFGKAVTLNVDYDNSCVYHALLNPSLADLPDGALVSKATLTLSCVNAGGDVNVSYADSAWKEDTVRYNDRPENGAALGKLSCAEEGAVTFDLTAAVAAWLSGEHPAYGLYLRTEAQDGTDFASSQAATADSRPSLSVTYTLPAK